uniref:Uncharacterized protein n=1 Tax=Aegilops tauschii subsp. strangulata TaxID=200361 RepID=A0A452Y9D8_AEGTS
MFPSTKCFLLGFRRNLLTLLYMQVDETEVIGVLLQTELIPLCRRTMEMGSELSENPTLPRSDPANFFLRLSFAHCCPGCASSFCRLQQQK